MFRIGDESRDRMEADVVMLQIAMYALTFMLNALFDPIARRDGWPRDNRSSGNIPDDLNIIAGAGDVVPDDPRLRTRGGLVSDDRRLGTKVLKRLDEIMLIAG